MRSAKKPVKPDGTANRTRSRRDATSSRTASTARSDFLGERRDLLAKRRQREPVRAPQDKRGAERTLESG